MALDAEGVNMGYNELWCLAYNFGASTNMTKHRLAQFASDYAQVFEGVRDPCLPADFSAWASSHDFHYHDHNLSG
jgi:hypothetical protein